VISLRRLLGGLTSGIFLSSAVHAGTIGGLYYIFFKRGPAIVAELDLSLAPMLPRPPNAGGGRARPAEEWLLPPPHKKAPVPVPPPPKVVMEEPAPVPDEPEELACPEPCAETTDGTGGGGTGESEGLYIPAAEASRKPRWVGNFITPMDYPRLARENDKDGRVVLSVLIDDQGRVRDARLLQGAYEALNEVALRKVREAKFTPAYNAEGRAVACQLTLPIRFELK